MFFFEFLLEISRQFFQEWRQGKELFLEKISDLAYLDTQVNLLNKSTDELFLLFDYLELCSASEHRDRLLSKVIGELELRAENRAPHFRTSTSSYKDLKKIIKEEREFILESTLLSALLRKDYSSVVQLLPGSRRSSLSREDFLRSSLRSKRAKINALRKDKGKERKLREQWDEHVIHVQLHVLLDSEK